MERLYRQYLRVRYETEEEYRGFLDSLQDRFNSSICFNGVDKVKKSFPIIHIAEPFDGHVRCYNITPIIAKYLSARACVVLTGGPCSGPKYGLNIHDISHYLVQAKQIHYLKIITI